MIRTLRLIYSTDAGKNYYVSLNYAKEAPVAADVAQLANDMLDHDFFAESLSFTGADLTARTTTVIV
ncbi:MAG: DUF2922 domain-containing protein [Synergistaceae bacterium]|nr:DUF2922 domain-containing protein [Synergistaceae bacterium]